MAQGMWTKRFTSSGKVFFYNSTLNKSEWVAPPNSVSHEAENLQIPKDNEETKGESQEKLQLKRTLPSSEPVETVTNSIDKKSDVVANCGEEEGNVNDKGSSNVDLAEQLLSSVIPLAQQQQPSRQHRSKRFKAEKSGKSEQDGEETSQSSYHKMVNTYQAMAGEKGDEGGKWLVR